MAPPPILRVTLFGTPGFVGGDRTLTVDRVQNRALLYRLAANLQPVARSELAFLFWPNEPDARAQRLLTKLISQVRSSLPGQDLLLTTKDTVLLDERHVSSDCADFASLCSSKDNDRLTLAIDLYRGPFLAGFSLPNLAEYEAWAVAERSRYEQMCLGALRTQLGNAMNQEEWRHAIDLAHRYLAIDDLAEDIYRRLIQCYGTLGERSTAVQQYERCAAILLRELGVTPLPETRAVYDAVLTESATQVDISVPPHAWATLPGPRAPMVGRRELLDRLEALFRQTDEGRGHAVLLTGEAGIGKSRLLQEFAVSVQDRALILAAACRPNMQPLPYQPLVDALRPALRQLQLLRRIPPVWLRPLYVLIPELEQLMPEFAAAIQPLFEPERARATLFEAILQSVIAMAGDDKPVLICLDDLHWADGPTLEWLVYLAPQIQRGRLILCATYRSDEAESVADLRWALGRVGRYTEWTMPALGASDIRQLLDHLEVPSTSALVEHLHGATSGNPFFLLETVQGLLESGQLATAKYKLEGIPVSATMRETVDHRLARLQPIARQVVEAGAVLGISFSFAVAREVAGRSEMEMLDGLDELLHRHVLVEDNDDFRFNHEVTRSIVYRQLSQWRRRILHRRCAEVLESTLDAAFPSYRPAIVAQIGHHYAEANELAKAVNYLLEAGDHARNLYDHQAAIDYYQLAMNSLRNEDDPQRAGRVLMKLGLTYHTALDYEASHAAFEEAFRLLQRTSRPDFGAPIAAAPHPLRIVSAETHPFSFDPAYMSEHSAAIVGVQIFSGLVQVNAQLDIAPNIAKRWEVLDKGRKYLFHLRDDVRWSDGQPLTAHDFSYSWKRALRPENIAPCAYLLYDIRNAPAYHEGAVPEEQVGVRALDDDTLEVELEVPAPYFLYTLLYTSFLPVPSHIVNQLGDKWALTAQPVTNGAFRPQKWTRANAMILERNHQYKGRRMGNVEQVHYYTNDDWVAKLRMYEADELDVLYLSDPPTVEMDQARHLLATDYVSIPMLSVDFLGFNVHRAPFDDARVRQALGLAIDKDILANVVLQGYRWPAHGGFVPPGMPGHFPGSPMPHDPERARKLLAAAGYPNGRGFPEIEWYTGVPEFQPFADFVRDQWREHLNLNLPYEPAQWEELFRRIYTSPPHLFVMTWHADYPDPHTFLGNGPAQHYCKWQDEIYDLLIADASASLDQTKRIEVYQQLDRMLLEEGVIVPLTYVRYHMLVKPWIAITPFSLTPHWFWRDVIIKSH
jgi:ABC-type oligopeptide transport system substrate-binding subunit/DNA-binding SARP family transcriptional activator